MVGRPSAPLEFSVAPLPKFGTLLGGGRILWPRRWSGTVFAPFESFDSSFRALAETLLSLAVHRLSDTAITNYRKQKLSESNHSDRVRAVEPLQQYIQRFSRHRHDDLQTIKVVGREHSERPHLRCTVRAPAKETFETPQVYVVRPIRTSEVLS